MVSGMRYLQTCEKAPALVISHKKSSTSPRLETIVEEGSELNFEFGQKMVFFLLPVFLSVISYILLYRDIA
ncbi:Uncharacterized protein TCM_029429 [Theobroma cacao]|uniref:Uncharacterized protein n=1 Tax=Theobroma cacao TaxID=3641 RepID=A0A061GE09_THECC|nr:Uncharacterized protein TCM_029429 [Theobroma cacao]